MIEILPQSEGSLVAAKASRKLTQDDYQETWVPRLEDAIAEHGKVRVLLYLDETFEGWELGAMWEDAKLGLTNIDDFEKIALVGAPAWIEKATELLSHVIPGAVKTFPVGSLDEAFDWIK